MTAKEIASLLLAGRNASPTDSCPVCGRNATYEVVQCGVLSGNQARLCAEHFQEVIDELERNR